MALIQFTRNHTNHSTDKGYQFEFFCDRCGNVEDLEWYDVRKPASRALGKRVLRGYEVIFRGLCTRCAPRRVSR